VNGGGKLVRRDVLQVYWCSGRTSSSEWLIPRDEGLRESFLLVGSRSEELFLKRRNRLARSIGVLESIGSTEWLIHTMKEA